MRMKLHILLSAVIPAIICGCTKHAPRDTQGKEKVMIFYCAGFNNLSSDIQNNLKILEKGDLPVKGSRHRLLTFTHLSVSDNNFRTLTDMHLVELSKDFGVLRTDTLLTIDKSRTASDPEVLREVLERVAQIYPNAGYGLILSSHGTGWLPAGKYNSGNIIHYTIYVFFRD